MKVLIADDESVVLEGLKYIIDWDALGFSICSQASNGEETLNKILNLRPELVLLEDICLSYQDASRLLNRRFFCEPNQHVLGYGDLPPLDNSVLPRESWNEKTMEYPYLQQHGRPFQFQCDDHRFHRKPILPVRDSPVFLGAF